MMTEAPGAPRNARVILLGILLAATGLRLWHVGFGLPALNDPDEPLFVMKALDMLRGPTLDPGWFGHPATTLFYALAAIFAVVALGGIAAGSWTSASFAAAVFADPGLLVVPGRLLMVACGVACVYLSYSIGKRAVGPRTGLIGAALLAVNPLHVELSQIIRTDVMATALMLLSTRAALMAYQSGRRRDMVLAGVWAGLAVATKWPAATVLANVECVALWLAVSHRRRILDLPIAPVVAVAALLAASPFLVIDHSVVVRDLLGEARPYHLAQKGGGTGTGLLGNLGFYVWGVLRGTFGTAGLALAALGLAESVRRQRALAVAVFPAAIVFLLAISAQALVWERWAVPVLPFFALAMAVGIERIVAFAPARMRMPGSIALTLVLCLAMASWTVTRTLERADDTRQIATAWLTAHVNPRASVMIEHAAFDLMRRPGMLLYPMGQSGCVDIRGMLARKPSYGKIERTRAGSPIVDLGNVAPNLIETCRADYAVFTHYARYRAEGYRFATQLGVYRQLARGGRVVFAVAPIADVRGGPIVYIVRLRPSPPDATR